MEKIEKKVLSEKEYKESKEKVFTTLTISFLIDSYANLHS